MIRMVENDQAKILWDFQVRSDKLVVNQPDIMLIEKKQKRAVVIDVAIWVVKKKEPTHTHTVYTVHH